jgi:hypothetical protein
MPIILSGTTGEISPTWTTAGRPSTPSQGQTGYNTTLNTLETYNGTSWIGIGAGGYGPAFSAYISATQTLTINTNTKLQVDTKEFDTNSGYNTSLYRYTPGVAGIYQVNGTFYGIGTSTTNAYCWIYKNGSPYQIGSFAAANANINEQSQVSILMQLNATDYIELWGAVNCASGASAPGLTSGVGSRFSAALIRTV